jgi:hypothetical protein
VITFYSPEAVIMTSEDFAPQRGAMHQSSVSNVIFHPQSHVPVAAALHETAVLDTLPSTKRSSFFRPACSGWFEHITRRLYMCTCAQASMRTLAWS